MNTVNGTISHIKAPEIKNKLNTTLAVASGVTVAVLTVCALAAIGGVKTAFIKDYTFANSEEFCEAIVLEQASPDGVTGLCWKAYDGLMGLWFHDETSLVRPLVRLKGAVIRGAQHAWSAAQQSHSDIEYCKKHIWSVAFDTVVSRSVAYATENALPLAILSTVMGSWSGLSVFQRRTEKQMRFFTIV